MSELDLMIFDTETTGIPIWKEPSGGDNQPHIVEVAAVIVNPFTEEVKGELELIVAPDGWEIPDEVAAIHGLTTELATENGLPETEVLQLFLDFWGGRKRIAFNTTFDNRIVRIATKRFCDGDTIDFWKAGSYECAMIGSRKVMGGKQPKLSEAYEYFTGKPLEEAHSAMADVKATIEVYFKMKAAAGQVPG